MLNKRTKLGPASSLHCHDNTSNISKGHILSMNEGRWSQQTNIPHHTREQQSTSLSQCWTSVAMQQTQLNRHDIYRRPNVIFKHRDHERIGRFVYKYSVVHNLVCEVIRQSLIDWTHPKSTSLGQIGLLPRKNSKPTLPGIWAGLSLRMPTDYSGYGSSSSRQIHRVQSHFFVWTG